jgi:localization factor PodJL
MGAQGKAPAAPAAMPMSLPYRRPISVRFPCAKPPPAMPCAHTRSRSATRSAKGRRRNLTEAARWLERAASAGLAPAQYRLGAMYERGQGVAKDLGRARSWYQAAAEKGNVKAMHNLAVNSSGREDGGADYALASKWYGEAASYGLADSQFNLGIPPSMASACPRTAEAINGRACRRRWKRPPTARSDRGSSIPPASLTPSGVGRLDRQESGAEANEVLEPQEWAEASAQTNASRHPRAGSPQ